MSEGRSMLIEGLSVLIIFATLIQFGNWQMRRLAWKETLIEQASVRTVQAPVDLPPAADWTRLEPDAYEYVPVRLRGRFLNDKERHVYTVLSDPKGRFSGPGYWIVTPLALNEGGHVLINRGFVPIDRKESATRREGLIAGETAVEGLMRAPEPRNLFTPEDDVSKNVWFVRDPERMRASLGLSSLAPFILDASSSPPGALPQGGETRLTFSNRHHAYALTWYGLALSLGFVYAGMLWSRYRRPKALPES